MKDPLKPDAATLCHLASVAVHADEFLSKNGHPLDKLALEQALKQPAVQEWLKAMTKQGLAPVKRNA